MKKIIFSVLLLILAAGSFLWSVYLLYQDDWQTCKTESSTLTQIDPEVSKIYVDVSGAVKKPGLYELHFGDRVAQAVATAGGFIKSASADYLSKELNLASKLADEDKVHIPTTVEWREQQSVEPNSTSSISVNNSQLISINNASQQELESLEGIGEKRATDIIGGRPYQQIEELLSKAVLTESLFAQIKNKVKL